MKIYNSLSRKKETFRPFKRTQVGMYVCGPTVYDEPHLGHARAAFIFEVIRNYFEYKGYKVKFIKNITDVDDKIIAKAREELPDTEINTAVKEIARKYTQRYYEDMQALGIRRPSYPPKASEHIGRMQDYIGRLIKNKSAYVSEGSVYFDVHSFRDYGRLSRQDLKQMRSAVRIEHDEKKRDALDFALWKKAKDAGPSWDSPWGKGRPGWHIECSVMSSKYLGEEFDIHAGGMDLIFPHHENEIAQARCFSKKRFARIWMHNGLLTINRRKMAKSLGNFVTIKDFIHKHKYQADVLKFFFLQTHYSQPIDFTWPRMKEKKEALNTIKIFLDRVKNRETKGQYVSSPQLKAISPRNLRNKIERLRREFVASMDDDFNTPCAVAVLFEIVKACNKVLYTSGFKKEHLVPLKYAAETIKELSNIFALSFQAGPLPMSKKEIEDLIKLREKLRAEKKFKQADKIRKELTKKNIILEDTRAGVTWRGKV